MAAVVLAACVVAGSAGSKATTLPRTGVSTRPGVEVTWVGGPTMLIRFGDLTLLTDPVLGPEGFEMGDPNVPDLHRVKLHRRLAPLRPVAVDSVDVVLLSHVHEDHFDREAQSRLHRTLPVILPSADVEAVAAKGFEKLDGLRWGESRELRAGTRRVRITATAARHSRDPEMAGTLGEGNGYWIEFTDGDWTRTLYWTGDTMPTPEVVEAVQSFGAPDVMVTHVGGVGTAGPLGQISMGAVDVEALAAGIRPKRILPIHHSTFEFYREPISEVVVRKAGKPYRVDLIAEGATIRYDE